jgi:hypothetical protein
MHLFPRARKRLVGLALVSLMGCSGETVEEAKPADQAEVGMADDVVDQSWVVQLSTTESLGPFLGDPGWATYVMKRQYRTAVQQFGSKGGQPLARVHEDIASLYRQAAILAANSLVETFEKTPAPEDPLGVAHLLSVSHIILGDLEAAKKASEKMNALSEDPSASWHAPWKTWLDAGGTWPPDLSTLPVEVMVVTPGQWPGAGDLPHYQLPEQTPDARMRDIGDPGVLVALALWHSAAARAAAPGIAKELDTYSARYRMPAEGMVTEPVSLPIEFLFGSDFGFAGDAAFLTDTLNVTSKVDVDKWSAEGSGLANMVAGSSESAQFDALLFADAAANYRDKVVERATVKTGGSIEGFHRTFAGMARIGSLRTAAEYAEALGDRETSGKLRILAMEAEGSMETRNKDYVGSPLGMLSLAAWDAGNRYPTRALDILHNLVRRYESLETARFALDALALRVSREGVGENPGM